jgi:di/tricarboxylate transporter
MTPEIWFVFGVLAAAVGLFASDRVRLDWVALLVLLSLLLSGILTVGEALAGFSDPVVLMIAGLFVVGEALVTTGVAHAVGDWLMRVGGGSENRILVLLMAVVAGFGAFMSSTGIVAIFIPIVLGIAARSGIDRRGLLMPLAFAALISGMLTLIATPPNLVINAELNRQGLEPFNFFDFTPFGLAILVIGIVYMLTIGRRLLATESEGVDEADDGTSLEELVRLYGLTGRLHRLRLAGGSPLVGQTLAAARLRSDFAVNVVGVERSRRFGIEITPALPRTQFNSGDILYVVGGEEPISHFMEVRKLQRLALETRPMKELAAELGLAEVLLGPESDLIGRTIGEAALRTRHHVSVLAVRRKTGPIEASLTDLTLRLGDSLLVAGGWQHIGRLREEKKDFIVLSLPREMDEVAPARRKAPYALAIVAMMIVAMTFGLVANVTAVLIAALALVTLGCLTMDGSYRVINWPSLVLIAGMLPLATALDKTGGTRVIAEALVDTLGGAGPYGMMAGLFVLTSVLGAFVSNTATAVLMAPVAIGAARLMEVAPHPYLMTVALAASAAFMTPVSSPVNTLVVTPGGYRFGDFVKIGVPMTILTMAATLILVPLILPLQP